MILVPPKGAVPTQTLDNTVRPVTNSRTDSQGARRQVTVYGKLYNISVAVCAVSLVILVVFGALFIVFQGLVSYFWGVDLWTPVADALGSLSEGLSPLFEDLAERTQEIWRPVVDGAGGCGKSCGRGSRGRRAPPARTRARRRRTRSLSEN